MPFYWRTESRDSKPGFLPVYNAFDAISPWAVGRYRDDSGYDANYHDTQVPDKAYVDYFFQHFPSKLIRMI